MTISSSDGRDGGGGDEGGEGGGGGGDGGEGGGEGAGGAVGPTCGNATCRRTRVSDGSHLPGIFLQITRDAGNGHYDRCDLGLLLHVRRAEGRSRRVALRTSARCCQGRSRFSTGQPDARLIDLQLARHLGAPPGPLQGPAALSSLSLQRQ